MEKPRLVMIARTQFGYHTDSFKIASYLKNDFDIVFVCLDGGASRIDSGCIRVNYTRGGRWRIMRVAKLISASLKELRQPIKMHVILWYFPFCCLVSIFSKRKIILDFRTGNVNRKWYLRRLADSFSSVESVFFRHVSVISDGLRAHLKIPKAKTYILPLGADIISAKPKQFDYPRLFYIGTFNNRNLEQTFEGLCLFLQKCPEYRPILRYDVVGYGWRNEEAELSRIASKLGLDNNIRIHGKLTHNDAKMFFDNSNIGVSYIPITEYFDHQPPTKTYEYVLSGMAVIATSTTENAKLISSINGVLCEDNAESFALALKKMVSQFSTYKSNSIRTTLADRTWDGITRSFKAEMLNGE